MNRALRLFAPAKINWTLEILHRRPDGYHEIRSVLQTIDLCDVVTLTAADGIELTVRGDAAPLMDEPAEQNLAWRAAGALRRWSGTPAGVRIELEKCVPVAAGLGGGSSDAAAVLRGCSVLWDLDADDASLMEIAAGIGSDVPFFIGGGTAEVRGRGEVVRPLPDAKAPAIMLATPPRGERREKTSAMFGALAPGDYSEGYVTIGLADAVEAGRRIADEMLNNVFERVTSEMQPETERAMDALRASGGSAHLAGAGPSFFVLLDERDEEGALAARASALGFEPRVVNALSRDASLQIEEI